MGDILATIGNLIVIPGMLLTLLDKRAYVPRITSGVSVVGLTLITIGLLVEGLVLSPLVLVVIGLMWLYLFVFRGRPYVEPIVEVEGEKSGG